MLVRESILRQADDQESTKIRKAFSLRALKVFKHLTPMTERLSLKKIDELAMKHMMMEAKSDKVSEIVVKYGSKLLCEYHHFLEMHGFTLN